MKKNIRQILDFEKVDALLEGFNRSTGFVTAILDLDGNVLSKSGWRQICTEFHRINPETSRKCTISDTELAGKMGKGETYHFYECLNGLVDVAVPVVIKGEHIANLFSGQFFFEKPDIAFFKKQAGKYGFDEETYLAALNKVPVVSQETVRTVMDFLQKMTQMISELAFQRLEQAELFTILKESEEKFKFVFEAANVGKSMTLPTGEIDVNQSFCDLLGYSREELRGKKWQDITPACDVPVMEQLLEPLLRGEKDSARFEKRYICKNGSYIWTDLSITLRRDDKGKPQYFVTTLIDITERKQAEESLKAYTERLKILHRIDLAILEGVDSPEKITLEAIRDLRDLLHCQRVSVGLFDFEKKEVRGLAACGDAGPVAQTGQWFPEEIFGDPEIFRQKKPEVFSALNKSIRDGEARSSVNVPVLSPKGLTGVLNIGWDTPEIISGDSLEIAGEVANQISIAIEQARLMEETKRHAEDLEERVRLRTAQLEDSNKEHEAFSYSVSHDLRAPLRHINGYVELLIDRYRQELPEKARHYLDTISEATHQMGALIDDLLQYSRIGRQELRQGQPDMTLLVKEVIDQLKTGVAERNILWNIKPLPRVNGDMVLLRQVWTNLLDNAVKYTRNKETAEISVGYGEDAKEFVFCVCDNGAGFDMRYAKKLFGVFQRLHAQSEFEGTGIGLANVQRIVQKHMGRVWAEAEPGKGAKFYFSLPKYTEETP